MLSQDHKQSSSKVQIAESDEAPLKLMPAHKLPLETLVNAYNHTRVDYIVPMPMNQERLNQYIRYYDVDQKRSAVALHEGEILGLGMLGVRPDHTWITRLGVIPNKRKRGTGRALMEYLIAQSESLGVSHIILEVIVGNKPAHNLFRKLGFQDIRELLIVRRPPGPPEVDVGPYKPQLLNDAEVIEHLTHRQSTPSWLDEFDSLRNTGNLAGHRVRLPEGDRGWLIYQKTALQLGRLVLQTEVGNPHHVALALIHALHRLHPSSDTKSENLPVNDPHWPALQEMGYFETFRRIEMRLDL
jgi:ribosomal protein S18 acetylase RimI-like enzyme